MGSKITENAAWQSRVTEYLEQGLFADALVYLEGALADSRTHDEELDKLSKIIEISYTQSRQDKAFIYAQRLASICNVSNISWAMSLLLSYATCFSFLVLRRVPKGLLRWVCRCLFPQYDTRTKWPHLKECLFGQYWHNIRFCAKFPLLMIVSSENANQELFSIGLVGYTTSFAGHSLLGNLTMRRVINTARRIGAREVSLALYTHLAIGYQMAARPLKTLALYDEFTKEFESIPSFYDLLISANKTSLSLTDLGPCEGQKAIIDSFKKSFSLSKSRNHIQIYGGQAILLALEKKSAETLAFLEKSFAAAEQSNNPLDFLYYYRIEVLVHLLSGEHEKCEISIRNGRAFAEQYGKPKWLVQEFDRITCVEAAMKSPSVFYNKYQLLRFLWLSVKTRNLSLASKGFRILKSISSSRVASPIGRKGKSSNIFRIIFMVPRNQKLLHLGQISLQIASAFIKSSFLSDFQGG